MRKTLITGLIGVLALAGTQNEAAAFEMRKECRYYAVGGPGWSPMNVRDTGICAAKKVGINVRKFLAVMSCESGYQPYAVSPSGEHFGPMQYLPSTFYGQYSMFPDLVRWFRLVKDVHRPRSTVIVAARFIRGHGYYPWSCG